MIAQGFIVLAFLMSLLNIWITQDKTIYNFAVAGCNLLRTEKRRLVTVVGATIGKVLAVGGMYNLLIPYLILLGTFIPPIGGVIMADFWLNHKEVYPKLADNSARTLNIHDRYGIQVGNPGSFILLDGEDDYSVIRQQGEVLLSVRHGEVIMQRELARVISSDWIAGENNL